MFKLIKKILGFKNIKKTRIYDINGGHKDIFGRNYRVEYRSRKSFKINFINNN